MIVLWSLAGAGFGVAAARLLRVVGAGVSWAGGAVVAAVAWGVVGWRAPGWPAWWLPVPVVVTAFAVPLLLADLRHLRLPTVLTASAYPALAAAVAVVGAAAGPVPPLRALGGALVFGGVHLAVHLLAPAALGAGDVKLSGAVGAVLGLVSWAALVLGVVLAALVTVVLSALAPWVRGWRRGVPHGPGLLLGAWLAAVFPACLWPDVPT